MFTGAFGVVFGLIAVFVNDGNQISNGGFFQGYNSMTWMVISLQVFIIQKDVYNFVSVCVYSSLAWKFTIFLVYFVSKNVDRLTTEKYKLNWFEPQQYIHTTVHCNVNVIFFSERKSFDAYETKTLIGCEVLKVDVSLVPYFDL